jgi:hypothetical protein
MAVSTQIILYLEMQEFSQIIFSKKFFFYQGKMKNILKYSRMLLLFSKWISQN